ncbi:MAG: hypothetical protein DSY53_02505 [Persephonella sp.]|nr:MAG: hypothetical protein DSY53_02505 [Persephonella sp.]
MSKKVLENLQNCVNYAIEELGDGLIASDIFSSEGLPVVDGYNSNEKATALFASITEKIRNAVNNSHLSNLGDYYIINLQEGTLDLVIVGDIFQWKLLINTNKIKLGYIFSIFLPEAIKRFKEAEKG